MKLKLCLVGKERGRDTSTGLGPPDHSFLETSTEYWHIFDAPNIATFLTFLDLEEISFKVVLITIMLYVAVSYIIHIFCWEYWNTRKVRVGNLLDTRRNYMYLFGGLSNLGFGTGLCIYSLKYSIAHNTIQVNMKYSRANLYCT